MMQKGKFQSSYSTGPVSFFHIFCFLFFSLYFVRMQFDGPNENEIEEIRDQLYRQIGVNVGICGDVMRRCLRSMGETAE